MIENLLENNIKQEKEETNEAAFKTEYTSFDENILIKTEAENSEHNNVYNNNNVIASVSNDKNIENFSDSGFTFVNCEPLQHNKLIHDFENENSDFHCTELPNFKLETFLQKLNRTKDEFHKCNHCSKFFSTRTGLHKHLLSETHEQLSLEVQSTILNRDAVGLIKNIAQCHNSKYARKCYHCDQIFYGYKELNKHVLIHFEKKSYKCLHCNKEFYVQSSLDQHMKTHEVLSKCSYCDKICKSEVGLKAHMVFHTQKSLKCSYCDKICKNEVGLQTHTRFHTQKSLKCSYCDETFHCKSDLFEHVKVHGETKPYKCSRCGEGFSLNKLIYYHRNRRKKCPFCIEIFCNQALLQKHLSKNHANESLYHCTCCSEKFKTRAELRDHLTTHAGEKIYKCDYCGERFMKLLEMKDHEMIHWTSKIETS